MRPGALRSELLNVTSTSTARVLLLGSMAMAAASLLANLATFATEELGAESTIEQAMHASTVATVTFAMVAGLVSATTDYRFGRIDQLLLSEPRTSLVLRAKAVIGLLIGVVYGLAGSVVALVVISTYYGVNDVGIELGSAMVVRPLVGAILASGLFAVVGIGAGTAIRNQPAALAGGLAALLIVQPPMLLGLPSIGRWLPGASALSMTLAPDPELLGQVAGGLVMLAWTALAVVAGNRRLARTRA